MASRRDAEEVGKSQAVLRFFWLSADPVHGASSGAASHPFIHPMMSLEQIAFVTGSAAKLVEAERVLQKKLERVDLDLPEVQDVDVASVVGAKVRAAWDALGGRPVLVEDTGLALHAWNGLPGALVKWFVKGVGPAGICRMADGYFDRSATATCVVAVYDGRDLRTFAGSVPGRIAPTPLGTGGFGWDPCFIPEGSERSFAEMEPEEKDRFSMRRIAFETAAGAFRILYD